MLRDSDVRARFASREIPQALEDLGGSEQVIQPKERGMTQGVDDVWEVSWCAAGGYGDPLERIPASVLEDVLHGRVTRETAANVYGVSLVEREAGLEVDEQATESKRERARSGRLQRGRRWAEIERSDDAGQ
jgi:N-methylhydantoinase B/oxoprolinase/acetone carboxylase alpha subunit